MDRTVRDGYIFNHNFHETECEWRVVKVLFCISNDMIIIYKFNDHLEHPYDDRPIVMIEALSLHVIICSGHNC
jgi:hypothetical protein